MFNSETLEVGIGMAFLFLLASVICTAIREWLEGILKWRAADLERGLRTLLDDADGTVTAHLFDHPMINSLFAGDYAPADHTPRLSLWDRIVHSAGRKSRDLPSYIPAANFATAFLDYVARGRMNAADPAGSATAAPLTVQALRDGVAALPSEHLRRFVLSTLDYAGNDLDKARLGVQQWFDSTMDRVSGWYRRRTQWILFFLGLATAVVVNVDSLYVIQRLISDKTLRTAVTTHAEGMKSIPACRDEQSDCFERTRAELLKVGMPIGWVSCDAHDPDDAAKTSFRPRQLCADGPGQATTGAAIAPGIGFEWISVLAGWFVTAFAVMLGAPFWFDVLNRFMVIRSTVKPDEKSPEEPSKDGGKVAKTPAASSSQPPEPAPPPDPAPSPGGAPALPIADALAAFVPHQWQPGRENAQEVVL